MFLIGLLAGLAALAGGTLALASAWGVRTTHRRHPPCGEFLEVDGQRLHYTDRGNGPPIVLVHGASSNLLEFERSIAPLLAERCRVLCFDRPGCGHSPRHRGEWLDPTALARLLLTACDQLGAAQPVIVGHSWAGAIVLAALVHEGPRVRAGVLLAGVAGHWIDGPTLGERLGRWPGLLPLFAYAVVPPLGPSVLPRALAPVFAPQAVPPNHASAVGARLAVRPEAFLQDVEDIKRLNPYLQLASPAYRTISRPVLALHGKDDDLVPYWNHGQRFEHLIEDMTVELLAGHGHALHHVDPQRIAASIHDFLHRIVHSP